MTAKFRVKDTFSITGRGFVIAGDVLSGVVNIGDLIWLKDNSNESMYELITGVEMGTGRNDDGSPKHFVGLVLGNISSQNERALKTELHPGVEFEVQNNSGNEA